MTKIKICGLTTIDDALDAIDLGADYLGFNFYPDSKRYIDPNKALAIFDELPFNILKVGVFVNATHDFMVDMATQLNLDYLQLHGDETPDDCEKLARPLIKAFRPERESDLDDMNNFDVDSILIDSFVSHSYGGTGVVSNWDFAKKAKQSGKPLFLSGGLNPENIEMALSVVKPFAVDVASGVEDEPGVKSHSKMEEFIKKVRQWDEQSRPSK